ncbi:MAG: hypothetical protein RL026_478 [Pseudomonadota bacterium]|jgi:LPS export ABC transporter protein LptC
MRRQAALWALAGGALALAFLLGRGGRTPGQASGETPSPAPPGFEALDARVVQTDESGAVAYAATARRVSQASDDAPLRAQDLQIRQGSGGDWVLQAREGELPAGSGRLRLRGAVEARGTPPGGAGVAIIRSAAADYDARRGQLSIRVPVTVVWSGRHLQAGTVEADLKTGRMQLEGKVHGRFRP